MKNALRIKRISQSEIIMSQITYEEVVATVKERGRAISPLTFDQPCTFELVPILAPFCEPWKMVAGTLLLSQTNIDDIDFTCRTVDDKKIVVLRTFMRVRGKQATYKTFIDALLEVGRVDHAMEVCARLAKKLEIVIEGIIKTCKSLLNSINFP